MLYLYSMVIKFLIDLLVSISLKFHLNEQLIGLVVMNIGSNIPDLVNACMCAKNDVIDIGLSAIFSSQVHNLLLGTSLP